MALFHEQVKKEGKQWRDITPAEARERMGRIARGLIASYRDGLLEASEQTRCSHVPSKVRTDGASYTATSFRKCASMRAASAARPVNSWNAPTA